MTQISFHPASADEFQQCCVNVFETWPSADTLEEHLSWRLASPQHQYAQWYVGTIDGRVVVSLGAYPMAFRLNGRTKSGFMIGAVHTVSDARGNRYAPRLINFAEQHQRDLGAEISVLFSDIGPNYYSRLGYTECPSYGFTADIARFSSVRQQLEPVTRPGRWPEDIVRISDTYETAIHRSQFAVERPPEYWLHLSQRYPNAGIIWLSKAHDTDSDNALNQQSGYCVYRIIGQCLEVLDSVIPQCEEQHFESCFNQLIEAAVQAIHSGSPRVDVKSIRGWLPNLTLCSSLNAEYRTTEITMFKLLTRDIQLTTQAVNDARLIQLMDHV